MSELVSDCPRCGAAKITFDLLSATNVGRAYDWQNHYEAFCVCRHCGGATIFLTAELSIERSEVVGKVGLAKVSGVANDFVKIVRHISVRDGKSVSPPDHLPEPIKAAFREGAVCLSVDCFNAAAAMFRLCVDIATRELLPTDQADGLNRKTRRDLGLRLPWLFEHGRLPLPLRDLSHCIKEDGNDGAHVGTLTKAEAEDLLDFTTALLERLYTEPMRLELAKQRREERRKPTAS